jgi:hypothetical protein
MGSQVPQDCECLVYGATSIPIVTDERPVVADDD